MTRLFDTKLREEVVNGLVPCSLKYTGIFFTCINVKMYQCRKFDCFLVTIMLIYKIGGNQWNAGQCFLSLQTVEEGCG